MRHTLLFFNALLFFVAVGYAQSPPGINYQGVARDNTGKQLSLKDISIKISIVKGSAEGTIEYSETHSVKTNSFGLFTLVIGNGDAITGDFQFVSWAVGDKWLRVEMDPNGGSSFQLLGSQQLMSVPYAFYAKFSGNSLTAGQGISITNNAINNTGDSDNNPSNELNTGLTLGSDLKLKLTDAGGTKEVDLSSLAPKQYVDDKIAAVDGSTSNEIQNLNQVLVQGNDAGGKKITNLATPTVTSDAVTKQYVDDKIATVDGSTSNEIQSLSYDGSNKRLTISSGNFVDIPETQNLGEILTQGNDAGTKKITNLGTPTGNSDAVTKQYVDDGDNVINARISANYAFKTSFSYTAVSLSSDIPMPLSAEAFDDFNVVNASNFTAAAAGTYVFMVDGSISSPGIALSFVYNGTKYPFTNGLNNRFNSSFMFRLTAGQTVSIVADGLGAGSNITGTFFGYKLL